MKFSCLQILIIGTIIIVMNTVTLNAGYFNSNGQGVDGGTEANLYGFNTIILENTVSITETSTDSATEKTFAGGAATAGFYSENYKVYYIPLSFTISKTVTLSASIPWVARKINDEGDSFEASGLGDISCGLALFRNYMEFFDGTTSLKAVFPTGDNTKSDKGYYIPLGAGEYSFSFYQYLSKTLGDFSMYVNAGIIYSLETKPLIVGSTEYQFHNGNVYSGLLGFEYTLFNNFIFVIKGNYVYVSEGQVKTQWVGWHDANDFLQTSDAIAGIEIDIVKDVLSISVMYIQPVYTKHDPDVENPKKRKSGISFGVSGLF